MEVAVRITYFQGPLFFSRCLVLLNATSNRQSVVHQLAELFGLVGCHKHLPEVLASCPLCCAVPGLLFVGQLHNHHNRHNTTHPTSHNCTPNNCTQNALANQPPQVSNHKCLRALLHANVALLHANVGTRGRGYIVAAFAHWFTGVRRWGFIDGSRVISEFRYQVVRQANRTEESFRGAPAEPDQCLLLLEPHRSTR